MLPLDVSHLEESDIPERITLLYDVAVRNNLNAITLAHSAEELTAAHRRALAAEHQTKRFFKLSLGDGGLIGYCWITEIDWVNQTCELSIAILPGFRVGYGFIGLLRMYDYLYDTLNVRVVVNQILDGNEMLRSRTSIAPLVQVESPLDSLTCGALRTAYYWTQNRDEHAELARRRQQTRRSTRDNVLRRIG